MNLRICSTLFFSSPSTTEAGKSHEKDLFCTVACTVLLMLLLQHFALLLLLWGLNHTVLSCNEHRKFSWSMEENA